MNLTTRLLGLDPGLRSTGWGVIAVSGTRLMHVANGRIQSDAGRSLAERLAELHEGLTEVVARYAPDRAAVEHTFVNKNPTTTLKLGQARAIALLVPAQAGLPVEEYAPNMVKKTVVGVGHADKTQIRMMVARLLPGCQITGPDAADALAVAICLAHWTQGRRVVEAASAAVPAATGRL